MQSQMITALPSLSSFMNPGINSVVVPDCGYSVMGLIPIVSVWPRHTKDDYKMVANGFPP